LQRGDHRPEQVQFLLNATPFLLSANSLTKTIPLVFLATQHRSAPGDLDMCMVPFQKTIDITNFVDGRKSNDTAIGCSV